MYRLFYLVFAAGLSFLLTSCSGSRVDIVDSTLDRTLYFADTKAERLLRYFEVQALLVRFVAETGAGSADRNALALANIAATAQLNTLTECLQVGSVNMGQNDLNQQRPSLYQYKGTNESLFVRNNNAYCSFFESRLISYQDALFAMLRQAAHDDATAQLLSEALTGASVLTFTNFVTELVRVASSAYRDERILRAFTADALELEYLIWQPTASSPGQIYSFCLGGDICDDTTLAYPERAGTNLETLRGQLGLNQTSTRPEIRVWHFQEVYAFMISACRSLNGDVQAVTNVPGTHCSANMQFPFPLHLIPLPPQPAQKSSTSQPLPSKGGPAPDHGAKEEDGVANIVNQIDAVAQTIKAALAASNTFAKGSGMSALEYLDRAAKDHTDLKDEVKKAHDSYSKMQEMSDAVSNFAQQAKSLGAGLNAVNEAKMIYGQATSDRTEFFSARNDFKSARDEILKIAGI